MGDRGATQRAGHARRHRRRCRPIVRDAIEAGALGFSTSRTIAHVAIDGEPVPGTFAAEDELFGIGAALGELGTGRVRAGPHGRGRRGHRRAGQGGRLDAPPVGRDRPAGDVRPDPGRRRPDLWRELMDESLARGRRGRRHLAPGRRPGHRAARRATTRPTRCSTPSPPTRSSRPATCPTPSWPTRCATPRCASAILGWEPPTPATAEQPGPAPTSRTFLLGDPPDYEPGPERSLAGMAAAAGTHPARGRLRRHARRRRPGPALRPDPQLRRRAASTRSARCCCTRGPRAAWPTAAPTAA